MVQIQAEICEAGPALASIGMVSRAVNYMGVIRARIGGVIRARVGVIRSRFGVIRARIGVIRARVGVIRARFGVIRTNIRCSGGVIKPRTIARRQRRRGSNAGPTTPTTN
jgi:hypothetical protein